MNQPEALQVPEVQEIVRTRAAAKVYLSEPAHTEMARHPELHAATEGLAGLRGKLGLTSTVPVGQVSHLLTDQPRTVRDRAAEITEAVTAGATAAKVSRVGNVLRLQDGDGTVSHEIELRDPPVLVKRVGVLEARRDIGQSPNENLHGEREVQRQVTNQIGRNLSTLGSETAQIHSWQAT